MLIKKQLKVKYIDDIVPLCPYSSWVHLIFDATDAEPIPLITIVHAHNSIVTVHELGIGMLRRGLAGSPPATVAPNTTETTKGDTTKGDTAPARQSRKAKLVESEV